MKKMILPLIALAALVFGIGSVVRSQPKHEVTVPASPPPASPFSHTVAAVGLVETSTENIAIGMPRADVVSEVVVTVDQPVKTGDPLFKLDDASRQLSFFESLKDKNAISAEDLTRRRSAVETAQARLDEAKAQVVSAAAQIQMTETNLERSIVRAPMDGDVLQVKIHPGEFAPAGVTPTPLILLGRLKPLHIRVDVDEHEAWRVRPEAKATAAVRGNAHLKAPLTFVRFEPFVVPKKSLTGDSTERVDTRVLQVIYRVEGDALPLFVGQQMDVFIDGSENKNAVTMK